jgi:hypothetical protein
VRHPAFAVDAAVALADQPVIYPLAGHGVANLPYLASMTEATHPVSGAVLDFRAAH